ncbi:DUF3275 family protein [Xylophilus sp. ASV27]|uniref:DUF3275 family protein n=1 Tax=Xylophilus sp. ASV27 TaxID=2795129 RepID=UPI0018EA39D9|nr:DUF3275 family protein [Xylophilus sp. ASV27]
MIKLSDVTLRVKKIRGSRNGDFCIADLVCDIGVFKVKDALLDQFDDGEYTGTVWISEIYLAQYIAFGKGVTEIRARLHDLQLDGAYDRQEDPDPVEPDPADEQPPRAVLPARQEATESDTTSNQLGDLRERLAAVSKSTVSAVPPPAPDEELEALFGDLWDAIQDGKPVKLDPTVERALLRKQAQAIRQLGYRLDPIAQTFMPATP